jgi:hypothetical protein
MINVHHPFYRDCFMAIVQEALDVQNSSLKKTPPLST